MFPNPQDALPPAPGSGPEVYRALAESLAHCDLAAAQRALARAHGFASWEAFEEHLDALQHPSDIRDFEAAADAIITGDEATLARLLREKPELIRMRSTREHRATLLHYVSANGVENWRQKSPANAARITAMLLDAGAEVDAAADVYGGGATTLGLVATSFHPEKAGVAEEVMQLLLDRGAALERAPIVACLANGRLRAAQFLAKRGAHIDFVGAAGLGRVEIVEALLPHATRAQIQNAFLYACEFGQVEVARLLLDRGAAIDNDENGKGLPGLHWAIIGGHLELIDLLLARGASLTVCNRYGGDAFGAASWARSQGSDIDAVLQRLRAAS